jgi:hypothetical protein
MATIVANRSQFEGKDPGLKPPVYRRLVQGPEGPCSLRKTRAKTKTRARAKVRARARARAKARTTAKAGATAKAKYRVLRCAQDDGANRQKGTKTRRMRRAFVPLSTALILPDRGKLLCHPKRTFIWRGLRELGDF